MSKKCVEFEYTQELIEELEKWLDQEIGHYNGENKVLLIELVDKL